jgi:adenylate kinase
LNFFDEKEIDTARFTGETVTGDEVLAAVTKRLGKPHNYGPSAEQLAEQKRKVAEDKVRLRV